METYHALTPIAPSELPTAPGDRRPAIPPAQTPEPEPAELAEQPAAVVNMTIEELAREGAAHYHI